MKFQKKFFFFFFFWGGGVRGAQVRCEQRSEVFVKIQKKNWGIGLGGQDGCERRIEVFCENSKKQLGGRVGGSGWGVRVDVNREVKFL